MIIPSLDTFNCKSSFFLSLFIFLQSSNLYKVCKLVFLGILHTMTATHFAEDKGKYGLILQKKKTQWIKQNISMRILHSLDHHTLSLVCNTRSLASVGSYGVLYNTQDSPCFSPFSLPLADTILSCRNDDS